MVTHSCLFTMGDALIFNVQLMETALLSLESFLFELNIVYVEQLFTVYLFSIWITGIILRYSLLFQTMVTPLSDRLLHWGELENSIMYCLAGVEVFFNSNITTVQRISLIFTKFQF